MNNIKRILFFLFSLSMIPLVSSCGAKGDLYHPKEAEKTQPMLEEKPEKADESTKKKSP
ncbi:MAG: prokaryotic lipo-attachment site family protein [Litorilituus sp.]|jgi:predicted small lipoprotein YifL|nr:prokaryotic lipo-attachment site family protein [Litorilituus sp.]